MNICDEAEFLKGENMKKEQLHLPFDQDSVNMDNMSTILIEERVSLKQILLGKQQELRVSMMKKRKSL